MKRARQIVKVAIVARGDPGRDQDTYYRQARVLQRYANRLKNPKEGGGEEDRFHVEVVDTAAEALAGHLSNPIDNRVLVFLSCYFRTEANKIAQEHLDIWVHVAVGTRRPGEVTITPKGLYGLQGLAHIIGG